MLASVLSRLKSAPAAPQKRGFDRVEFPNPERNGRLALSSAAMKQVAKRLDLDTPLNALMAGLRTDAAEMPFDIVSEPAKDLTIIGEAMSGSYETARGFLYQAARVGFRTVFFTHEMSPHMEGNTFHPWHKIDVRGIEYQQVLKHTRARLLNLCEGPVSREEIFRVFHNAFTDFGNRHLIVSIFVRRQDPERYDAIMKDVFWALRAYDDRIMNAETPAPLMWAQLREVVFAIPGSGIPKPDMAFLRRVSGGVVTVFSYEDAGAWAEPAGPCLFGTGTEPVVADLGPGEFFLGRWRQEIVPKHMRGIIGPYATKATHVLDPVVERALDRITATSDGLRRGHVERLDLVAKACGYTSWHAAQGRKS